ncbi:zinc-binding dehydrogenase [Streptomyces pristinaespiralis]|uniref:zinc-binding dehydrogenase n=1 Tax=Streptomyces pristinaespiralis TaxID=38300 RepID=UPI0037BE1E42
MRACAWCTDRLAPTRQAFAGRRSAIVADPPPVLHTAKVEPGQSVAVFGVGGVGLSALDAAAAAGADPIIAVDLVDHKLQFAKEFGATHTINASNAEPVKAIWEIGAWRSRLRHGRGRRADDRSPDAAWRYSWAFLSPMSRST